MTPQEKLHAIGRIVDAWLEPDVAIDGGSAQSPSSWDSLRMIRETIGDDHAAEVERLRAENERLRADRDARRADGIYGAMIAAAYPHVSVSVAIGHAEDAVDAWRAAQKGGSDAG